MSKLSPMMEQYLEIKKQHPDKIVFFQVGDFYETFFEDAGTASREMEIALTTRDGNKENPIPLAGIPIHAGDTYINKLLAKGYKVAVCDQVEEAAQAKGLVRREITRILTPGTVTDPEMLEEGRNNYLASLCQLEENVYGLAVVDVSTGDFRVTELRGSGAREAAADELRRMQPAECLCSSDELADLARPYIGRKGHALLNILPPPADPARVKTALVKQWGEQRWEQIDLESYPAAAAAAAAALEYLLELRHPSGSRHFHNLELYFPVAAMLVDSVTSRNLELVQTIREGGKQGSLLGLLDQCMNAMGRRLLRRWVEQPLLEPRLIEERLEAVDQLCRAPLQRRELRLLLQKMIDLERFCSRLCYQRISARDLIALKNSLLNLESVKAQLAEVKAPLLQECGRLPDFGAVTELIRNTLVDDPPLATREGGLIREGLHAEVDRLKKLTREGRHCLLELEKKERDRTGIKSLRVGYTRNFGYYLEVTRTNIELVPPDYFRKQTLVNAERYITEELKEMEDQITGAHDRLIQLEYDLFEELRDAVAAYTPLFQAAAGRLARLDCLLSLAEIAERYGYCRPRVSAEGPLHIKKGRHPVVERSSAERFVPNDLVMDENRYVLVITGPNMAGKSTYIRSAALICLMAQVGSFVPAEEALLPVVDRIFARVGASDDLSSGYSTFMVEMQETAVIMKDATPRSLLILDEIGRGTSTYDGMSIARSVLEYISRQVKAKTLFSTHYHELTDLEGELPGVNNFTMAVKERGREVIFLRQVVPGRSDKSYGINVARLAGIPLEVILRAEAILAELEVAAAGAREKQLSILPLVSPPPAQIRQAAVLEEIKELDLIRLTPLEALQRLFQIQQRLSAAETAPAKEGTGQIQ
ncbi:MAG: DNA mismatch repair protein MutS [Bacillota bacterium]